MRVLICSDHYPPYIGGVQRQTRAIAQQLTERGHEVCVATVYQHHLPAFENADGFPVHRLKQLRSLRTPQVPTRLHQPPFPDPVTAIAIRRLVTRFRPDLVHSSGWFTYAAAAALLGSDVPLIASAREYGFSCANASLLRHGAPCSGPRIPKCLECSHDYFGEPRGMVAVAGVYLSKFLLRRKLQGLHSVSEFVSTVVNRDVLRPIDREHVEERVIGSFRVADDADIDDGTLAELPSEPFILFVGAIRRVKGVTQLLDAYEALSDPPPLVLMGTIEEDAPASFPDRVKVVRGASYATVLRVWDRALFGVMPSLWPEPFGSVVHEAMSRGRPVIGTTPGGHEDMIEHGVSGMLVPAGDVSALRDAMRTLLMDSDARERMGQRAAIRAEAFTAETAMPEFLGLYQRVLNRDIAAAPARPH